MQNSSVRLTFPSVSLIKHGYVCIYLYVKTLQIILFKFLQIISFASYSRQIFVKSGKNKKTCIFHTFVFFYQKIKRR